MFGPFKAGFFRFSGRSPGRCPGLSCGCPFGAESKKGRHCVFAPKAGAPGCHVIAPSRRNSRGGAFVPSPRRGINKTAQGIALGNQTDTNPQCPERA